MMPHRLTVYAVRVGLALVGLWVVLWHLNRHQNLMSDLRAEAPMQGRLLTYMNDTGTGLIEVRNGGDIISEANAAACEIFGYPPEGLVRLPVSVVLPKWFIADHQKRMQAAMDSAATSYTGTHIALMRCTAVKKNGDGVDVVVTVFIGRSGILATVNRVADMHYAVMPAEKPDTVVTPPSTTRTNQKPALK